MSKARFTRSHSSERSTPRFSQPKATSSPTREQITCESGSWSTSPTGIVRPGASRLPAASSKMISPCCVPSSSPPNTPAKAATKVDLPEPESPQSSTRSPGAMLRSMLRNAGCARPACVHPKPRISTRVPRSLTTSGRAVPCQRQSGRAPLSSPERGRGSIPIRRPAGHRIWSQ